ncbi:unnamed protein product [Diamesa tonsa]
MFKLVSVAFVTMVVVVSAQSPAKYPAGVDPAKCPNFPICDNAALHNVAPQKQWNQWEQPQPQQQWNAPQPQWNAPQPQQWAPQPQQWAPQPQQWNPAPEPQWNAPAPQTPSGGDKYPAGVSPQSCPNYPYCDVSGTPGSAGPPRVAPLQGFTQRLYPAGVSAQSCPNYPEC